MSQPDETLAAAQRRHWQATYAANPGMYGADPSRPAQESARIFATLGATEVLELGAGHGRDSLHFLDKGLAVTALDFSDTGLAQLRAEAERRRPAGRLTTAVHDVRQPLPLPDAAVDAVYAHMLLCMALSTTELRALMAEIHRVTRPGGVCVYTVRHTGDAHAGTGISHGDGIYEHGGFAVRFFDEELVNGLAAGWRLRPLRPFDEGELPRRLWRVTQIRD